MALLEVFVTRFETTIAGYASTISGRRTITPGLISMVTYIFSTPSPLILSRIVRRFAMIMLFLLTYLMVSLRPLVMLPLTGFLMLIPALLGGVSMVLPSLNTGLPVIVTVLHNCLPMIIAAIGGGLPVIIAAIGSGLPVRITFLVAILMSLDDAFPGFFSTIGSPAIVPLISLILRPMVPTGIQPTTTL